MHDVKEWLHEILEVRCACLSPGFHVAISFMVFFSVTRNALREGVTTCSRVLESILYSTIAFQRSDSTIQQVLSLGMSSNSMY